MSIQTSWTAWMFEWLVAPSCLPQFVLCLRAKRERSMPKTGNIKARRSILKNMLAAALCIALFEVFSSAAFCQVPGFGDGPDQWVPYKSGKYFEQLQQIARVYRFSDENITYLHFESPNVGVGPVDLFRFPVKQHRDCGDADCYFFALVASDHSSAPLLTPCQFKQAALAHLFNPDGSRFFGFEFSCRDTLFQVKVAPGHFMGISVPKTP